jgi:hypothetical protein
VINLSLHAFLFANSKEALQATIKTVETSTSENLEMSLQSERNSFFTTSSNTVSDAFPASEVPQTSNDPIITKRSKKGKNTKTKSALDTRQTEIDDGWTGITPS